MLKWFLIPALFSLSMSAFGEQSLVSKAQALQKHLIELHQGEQARTWEESVQRTQVYQEFRTAIQTLAEVKNVSIEHAPTSRAHLDESIEFLFNAMELSKSTDVSLRMAASFPTNALIEIWKSGSPYHRALIRELLVARAGDVSISEVSSETTQEPHVYAAHCATLAAKIYDPRDKELGRLVRHYLVHANKFVSSSPYSILHERSLPSLGSKVSFLSEIRKYDPETADVFNELSELASLKNAFEHFFSNPESVHNRQWLSGALKAALKSKSAVRLSAANKIKEQLVEEKLEGALNEAALQQDLEAELIGSIRGTTELARQKTFDEIPEFDSHKSHHFLQKMKLIFLLDTIKASKNISIFKVGVELLEVLAAHSPVTFRHLGKPVAQVLQKQSALEGMQGLVSRIDLLLNGGDCEKFLTKRNLN